MRSGSLPLAIALCLVFALVGAANAQEAAEPPTPAEASKAAEIQAEIVRFQTLGAEWLARTAAQADARTSAPEVLAALDAEIAELEDRTAPRVDKDLPLGELEAELIGAEQDLTLARKAAAALETEAAGRAERRKQAPDLLAAAKERLLGLQAAPAPPAVDPAVVEAQQQLAQMRRVAIEREIAAYEEELRSYDVRGQLLSRRRERAALYIAALEERTEALQETLAIRRQGEAAVAAEESQRLLESAEAMPPAVLELVRSLAEQNRELALQRTGEDGLLRRIEDTKAKLARAESQVAGVESDLEFLQRNVEAAGLSGSVGLVLRKTRSDAPDAGMYRRFIRMRRDKISEVQLRQIELAERRQAALDVDGIVAKRMAGFESVLTAEDQAAVRELLRDLLETQRRYLDTLISDNESYFQALVDFDARQRELVSRTESLMRFIDERVFWIPSGTPLPPTLARDTGDAVTWLFAPRFWGQVVRALRASMVRAPLAFGGAFVLLLAAPFALPRLRQRISSLGNQASAPNCIRMRPTGSALGLSLLLAFWVPGLLAFVGWRLGGSPDATQFVRCFAHGLSAAASMWATLLLARQLLRRRGIADAHLGWAEEPTRDLRWHLGWLAGVAVPAVFLIAVFELRGEEAWQESVGRLAFLVAIGAVMVFNHLILREEGALRGVVAGRSEFDLAPGAWRVVHGLAVAVAASLAVAALRGYTWTALQLAASIHVTLVFLFLLVFVYQLGARWFLVANRRLALRRWQKAQRARREQPEAVPDAPAPGVDDAEVELATVDEHTRRILRNGALLAALIGVWMIWADLVPATGALRSVELWKTTVSETIELTNAAGESISSVESRLRPITLADLLLALVVAAASMALARNLPGLLEVSLFRQLQTSAGERYAYTTIGKYAVTLTGVVAALNLVGVGWSSVQWLLAAVGIGLGFGLQEIFANFISGLIILFERPIRVGDTVTVGDISGTVSKIRIRATWITGFDRKELVVPNKEFITSRLVNWSLSDAILRVELPVGIAYGSDTEKASRLLEEVAERNEHVLQDPRPYALFRGFGDSALDFELRAFSPDVAHYLQILHELHMEIDRAFRAEGIEIAFPQRDLHLRSVPVTRQDAEADPGD